MTMLTLRELQSGFGTAMLGGEAAAIGRTVRGDGLAAEARLAIYRHHVVTSLTAALEATFPVLVRLVDPRFFRYLADRFIREHPPTSPCLSAYGAVLPEFLARFEASRHLAYLPDVARLEWAMNTALHAAEVLALPAEALRDAPPLALHPSVTLLDSPWPVDLIWRSNQEGAGGEPVDLDVGAVSLQVWRAGDDVVFRRLDPASRAFRHGLAETASLQAAAEAALAIDPETDLPSLIRALIDDAVLIAA
jgi:hypothetical protein